MTNPPYVSDKGAHHASLANQGTIQILLVDDDDVASESVIRNLRKAGIEYPVICAEDGQTALDILRGAHEDKTISPPFIVLLDLNMPRMNGFEFLEIIRADAKFKSAIVFVLTTSASSTDKARAYQYNVAGYLVKSGASAQFSKALSLINDYANVVSLPE